MTRILIGNDFAEDVRTDRSWTGWWVQRLLWFARDSDILVLPEEPDRDFMNYATSLTGTNAHALKIVIPEAGVAGYGTLTPDRLASLDFVGRLDEALQGRQVTEVFALWPDAAVARLARVLGVCAAMPGHGFVEQAGGVLVNSKSVFRAIAAGTGVPVPQGAVCTSRKVAEQAVLDLLDDGPAILKHDFLSGGRGNEILSRTSDVRPVGARRAIQVSGQADVRAYLNERWEWLSSGGRGRPVVERYHRDSSAYFAEFLLRDDGVELTGTGELLSAPYAVGQVMPASALEPEVFDAMVEGGRRLSEALRAMGYRGVLGPDVIVTPDRQVLFTEYNGRVTGSTHIYGVIGERIVGPGYGVDRMILERVWPEDWDVSSFAAAQDTLVRAGMQYDPERRTGVVFTNAFDATKGVMYCIVAEDLDQAWAADRALAGVFGTARS
jgi:hypothetical protein